DGKRSTTSTSKSNSKRPGVLAADAQWCVHNVNNLTVKNFALEHGHYERRQCHSRYKTIVVNNILKAEQARL
ncbi:hypothetical protein DM01DRAFT_1273876, partial [Hesseltinella vesiculosa]